MAEDFREFVDLRYGDLLRIAYLLTGSAHDAEDLVQSALLKVMRRWRKVEDPLAYLRRTMANQHISMWHRVRSREIVGATPPEPAGDDTADTVVRRQALADALRGLPPRTRVVVVLRYLDDLPEAEVAAMLGWPVGTVKSHASRGLARLRAALDTPELTKGSLR
ncbi:SigE family RNA polymerase sigma factor [Asanoa iriomotensis]|uniref:DNA-directed RNA polymerase sigma-70 factor n=1 Tax=Asanoa iriomotensis TaxID=234613 RepID=A0ABQ4CDW5_9ACTN|nr:SigE family RNA polymerase sigma factor [Asanoa iriomotensis]GIF60966.1 DNA-directed RNA polymerase sigma-70 factor [Asanoa iriomotensis]